MMPLVERLLRELQLSLYLPHFERNHLTDDLLATLTDADLKEIGISSLGHRKQILAAIASVARTPAEAQLRAVVVLFADLTGYTRLTRELPSEDMHVLLSEFFSQFDAILRQTGGTVSHIGDCVMAVFGTERSHGNEAERALTASIAMHAAMPGLSARTGRELSIHIGIAVGQVLFAQGGLGELGGIGFTVSGDSVNLASRIADNAEAGETLISERVYRGLEGRIICDQERRIEVQGFDGPVPVHRFRALRAASAPSRFVGRKTEIALADNLLRACATGPPGGVLHIRGEAGIGKTALVEQILSMAQDAGFASHRTLVLDFGLGEKASVDRDILAALSGLPRDASADAVRARTEEYLRQGALDPAGARFFELALGLVPAGTAQAFFAGLDSAALAEGRRAVVARVVQASARARPLLLVVEDIHWADAETRAILSVLAGTVPQARVCLILTERRTERLIDPQELFAGLDAQVRQIDLNAISIEEGLELGLALHGAQGEFVVACVRRAEGNPLFLEQLLRSGSDPQEANVPETIQGLIQSRVDMLSEDNRRILIAASVIGQRFDMAAAAAIAGIRIDNLAVLEGSALIRRHEDGYLFHHALIRDAVYSQILRDQLRRLHRAAADWFAPHDRLLHAEHLEKAADPDAAAAYLTAANEVLDRHRRDSAIALVDRGLALAGDDIRVPLLLLRGDVLRDLGRGPESIAAFESALAEAKGPAAALKARIGLVSTMRVLDRIDDAFAMIAETETLMRDAEAEFLPDLARLHYLKGGLCFPRGDFGGCLAAHRQAFDYAVRADHPELRARALSGLGDAYYAQGRMHLAHGVFEECLALCDAHALSSVECANRFMLGTTKIYMLETRAALDEALRSATLAQRIGQLRPEIVARLTAGWIYQSMAEHDAARQQIERGLEAAQELGAPRFLPFLRETLVRVCLSEGDVPTAHALACDVLEQARSMGAMNFIGPWVLASHAMTCCDPDQRSTSLAEGEALLAGGCVGHNHYRFRAYAIRACAQAGDWDGAGRQAAALAAYTKDEPTPWSDLHIGFGHALAAWGKGDGAARQALHDIADRASAAAQLTTRRAILEVTGITT
ncbi:adenylate/guanylate cyclase domain-containing protein [Paracoccus litorisediminis]|nr:adenylate/guanylate cyclase domain-containing protein [Paracoccus litorisediminis]